MAEYGFEILNADGRVTLSSRDIAYILIDAFSVSRPNNGSRSYPDLVAGAILEFTVIPQDPQVKDVPASTWGRATGRLEVSRSGTSLSWSWITGVNGFPYDNAIIYVYAR